MEVSLWTRTVAISGVQPDNLPWVLSSSPPFQPISLALLWMGTWEEGLRDIQPWSQKPQCSPGQTETSQDPESRANSHPSGGWGDIWKERLSYWKHHKLVPSEV